MIVNIKNVKEMICKNCICVDPTCNDTEFQPHCNNPDCDCHKTTKKIDTFAVRMTRKELEFIVEVMENRLLIRKLFYPSMTDGTGLLESLKALLK